MKSCLKDVSWLYIISTSSSSSSVLLDLSYKSLISESELPVASVSKHPYESEFRLLHKKGFKRILVLKQRHKVTWKWPIAIANN